MKRDDDVRVALRKVTEADVPVLMTLIRALAAFERLESGVTASEQDLHRGLFGDEAIAEAMIAWRDDEPIGFVIWYETFSTFRGRKGIYIEDLFVTESCRGSGVGRALLQHLAQVAVEQGCFRLEWEVLHWNEPAVAFYERIGGKCSREWDVYTLSGEALARLAQERDV